MSSDEFSVETSDLVTMLLIEDLSACEMELLDSVEVMNSSVAAEVTGSNSWELVS